MADGMAVGRDGEALSHGKPSRILQERLICCDIGRFRKEKNPIWFGGRKGHVLVNLSLLPLRGRLRGLPACLTVCLYILLLGVW